MWSGKNLQHVFEEKASNEPDKLITRLVLGAILKQLDLQALEKRFPFLPALSYPSMKYKMIAPIRSLYKSYCEIDVVVKGNWRQ